MKKKTLIKLASLIAVFTFATTPLVAGAQGLGTTKFGFDYAGQIEGLGTRDLRSGIMEVVNILMGFLGIIAIIIILIGGFKWMTAGGNDDKVAEARKLIVAGIIGLAIILASYAIAYFVVTSLMSATGSG
jgi:Zn-dependent protease with chaperone function